MSQRRRAIHVSSSLLSAVLVLALLAVTDATASAAVSCTAYRIIGARGSGDSQSVQDGLGAPGKQFKDELVALMGSSVSWSAVTYPAVSVSPDNPYNFFNAVGAVLHLKPLGAYTDSVREGTANTITQIESYHESCPDARFILTGYSQGAQAVGDAIQRMPASDRSNVVAAAFFGDPYFNAMSDSGKGGFSPSYYGALGVRPEWPASLHGAVFSYCHDGDPICNISQRIHIWGDGEIYVRNPARLHFGNHTDYASKGHGTAAAKDVAQKLGFDIGSSGSLDVAFAIDTTGSMSGAIETVRQNVSALADIVAAMDPNFRLGLVEYKDDPENDSPYQSRVVVPLTGSSSTFQSGLDTLSASGGGDGPESVYSGLVESDGLAWRDESSHTVILIGDAPPKDPEPVTGFTLDSVAAGASIADAPVFTVPVGSDPATAETFSDIALVTGGDFFPSNLAGRPTGVHTSNSARASESPQAVDDVLLDQIKAALRSAGNRVTANLGGPYSGSAGSPVALSAAGSSSTAGLITAYAWDFDNDGTIDEETAGPVTTHTYPVSGTYTVRVKVTTTSGKTSSSTATVVISAEPVAIQPPIDLAATADTSSAALSWRAAPGTHPSLYVVTDQAGNDWTIDASAYSVDGPVSVTLPDLEPDTTYRFNISAIDVGGGSPFVEFPVVKTAGATQTAGTSSFVKAAYQDFLSRPPTAGELSDVVAALDSGATSRAAVVQNLASSDEWISRIVEDDYQRTLKRSGDPGGVAYWTRQLKTKRRTVAEVTAHFYASNEYFQQTGHGSLEEWVTDLYRQLLGRAPDAPGVAHWVKAADPFRTPVAYTFFQSGESRRHRVSGLYSVLLGRAPDAAGLDYWANRVRIEGDIALASSLASSDEYYNRSLIRFPQG